ncbi:MAG: hypothetical protein JWP03_1606 [Phycisphaerales bacterium]|nr:hypothetical protein [Phycisphaerales bacterium]
MFFSAPIWLLALLPWGAVSLWLLLGRRRKTPVPFLELWKGPALQRPTRSRLQPPAVSLALALMATLLAVLAAGKPSLAIRGLGGNESVTIVVDRGMSMSAVAGGVPRFRACAGGAAGDIASTLGSLTPVDLVDVPGGGARRSSVKDLPGLVATLAPTAVDTRELLSETVRDRLATSTSPVIVFSDQALAMDNPRLVQIAPESTPENVGIAALSARETPSPQIMVRLRNDSGRTAEQLKVSSEGQEVVKEVALPPRGQERDYFFDLPRLGTVVEASLGQADDQSADDRAWLVREGSFPRIEPRAALPVELRRLIEVYTRSRPPTDASLRVAIVGATADLPADGPGVVVAQIGVDHASGSVTAAEHLIAKDVDWAGFPGDVRMAGAAPEGWTSIVSMGSKVIVAVRTQPARQVWVGFEPGAWSATPDYVVFWANVLNWAGSGQERFAGHPLSEFEERWKRVSEQTMVAGMAPGEWPGLFESADGTRRAFNATAEPPPPLVRATGNWRQKLASAAAPRRAGADAGPLLLVLAMACLAGSAATWKRRGLTPVSAGRTF